MNAVQFSDALGEVNDKYVMEAIAYERRRKRGWLKWGAWAACLGLILTAAIAALPGVLKGPVMPPPAPDPGPVAGGDEQSGTELPQPPGGQAVIINWDNVAVNESESLAPDAARLYRDPDLYLVESWGEEEVTAFYGWNLAPGYIPEGLSDGGRSAAAGVWRERATGGIVEEQAGRGFWSDFWEDGSPKSGDGLYIPTGFTVTASRLGILHCAIYLPDESRTTDFGGVPVTLIHCSLPYGPYDRTRRDPSGLHYMPAGYYDVYVASFTLDGVEYEIESQRLELEELVKITASVINVPPRENFTVGNPPPPSPDFVP